MKENICRWKEIDSDIGGYNSECGGFSSYVCGKYCPNCGKIISEECISFLDMLKEEGILNA